MRPIDLSKLRLFYEIAREGNLTRAAENLNITQPALSKSLLDFEDRIKTKLFERLPGGMRLTPQGERLYIHAKKILEEHEGFEREFFEKTDEISGEITIISFPYAGTEWLVPILEDFLKHYPLLDIKIRLESENINPTYADVAIGSFIPNQSHLIQKKLFDNHTQLFASKKYLSKYGIPQTPEDLDNHLLITYREASYYSSGRSAGIHTKIGRASNHPRRSHFQVDSLHGLINATLCGYGISELPNFPQVLDLGLCIVLPEIKGINIPLHYIFHENRKNSKKIKALYDYLMKKINSKNNL